MGQTAQIMVVDDEQNIRLTLSTLLMRAGYSVVTASSGEDALETLREQNVDLMLVDLKMPGMDGMELVRHVRERNFDPAIIVLTGHGSLETAVEGLHQGIFDYLLKTTDPSQVVERVKAGLDDREQKRRQRDLLNVVSAAVQELRGGAPLQSGAEETPAVTGNERVIAIGPLQLDTWHQVATLDGRSLSLTPTEFRVLLCLAEHAGQMLSYTQLVRCAQGYDTSELEAGELIKPHIHHLRQKLEPDPAAPRYLLNVRGKGYLLQITDV